MLNDLQRKTTCSRTCAAGLNLYPRMNFAYWFDDTLIIIKSEFDWSQSWINSQGIWQLSIIRRTLAVLRRITSSYAIHSLSISYAILQTNPVPSSKEIEKNRPLSDDKRIVEARCAFAWISLDIYLKKQCNNNHLKFDVHFFPRKEEKVTSIRFSAELEANKYPFSEMKSKKEKKWRIFHSETMFYYFFLAK